MKSLFIITMLSIFPLLSSAADSCLPATCQAWDTFCKSPKQIIATKCRLGVPVYHSACDALGVDKRLYLRGHGSLVDPLPCTAIEKS